MYYAFMTLTIIIYILPISQVTFKKSVVLIIVSILFIHELHQNLSICVPETLTLAHIYVKEVNPSYMQGTENIQFTVSTCWMT